MHTQSSSMQRKREVDPPNQHRLSQIQSPRHRKNVALRVTALSKCYGTCEAVANVSFDVCHGEIFGLLGLNGAGKTTLISMLATQRRPSSGDAQLLGHSIREERRTVRQLIGLA